MTRLRDLNLRRVYGPTRGHNALSEFLIPALSSAVSYDRVAGYFSSGSLAYTAPGISKLVARGGEIRLVTSHHLVNTDLDVLEKIDGDMSNLDPIAREFEKAVLRPDSSLESQMRASYVKAMCWLLRNGQLKIKFVVPDSINGGDFEKFHSKFGIIRDDAGDEIVFSGSTNETALGWAGNLENVDTKPLWLDGFEEFADYKTTFEDLWQGKNLVGWKTIDLPRALRDQLISLAPAGDFPIIDFDDEAHSDSPGYSQKKTPRDYQARAVEKWVDSGKVGLLAMATGTGKTFTAKLCIQAAEREGTLLVVLATPYQHISDQWASELAEFDVYQVGTDGDWKQKVQSLQLDAQLGLFKTLVIVVVNKTASSEYFLEQTSELAGRFDNFMFVGDEVHWLGATELRRTMNPMANFRLGLSATPDRYFDDIGTGALKEYFGDAPVYSFSLEEALSWVNPDTKEIGVLAPYEYHPVFVELTEAEAEEWNGYSRRIQAARSKEHMTLEDESKIERWLNLRAEIAKQAENKIQAWDSLLSDLGDTLRDAIVFAANETQLRKAVVVARNAGIDETSTISAEVGTSPSTQFAGLSERAHILSNFAQGRLRVIFAMKAMDEGVDVPSARIGILLASSGNSKEYIQRRGRLMRKAPGKDRAVIYDFVVLPPAEGFGTLRKTELRRALQFAEISLNAEVVKREITSMLGDIEE